MPGMPGDLMWSQLEQQPGDVVNLAMSSLPAAHPPRFLPLQAALQSAPGPPPVSQSCEVRGSDMSLLEHQAAAWQGL